MTFLIYPRWKLSDPEALPKVPFIVISVTDPENEEAEIADSPLCLGILRLMFHDVTGDYPGDSVIKMQPFHAQRIWNFLQSHLETQCIVCACEAGISRSAGIAAGICEALGLDGSWIKPPEFYPNAWVKKLVGEGAGRIGA